MLTSDIHVCTIGLPYKTRSSYLENCRRIKLSVQKVPSWHPPAHPAPIFTISREKERVVRIYTYQLTKINLINKLTIHLYAFQLGELS